MPVASAIALATAAIGGTIGTSPTPRAPNGWRGFGTSIMIEVPNPRHPFGARGVGEVPIVPPMAAVANAIADATGIRLRDLPMSPPKLRAALDAEQPRLAAE